MSQIVGYVHENMDRYMLVSVFEAWAAQRATAAERDQWRPVTWADGQGNETVDLRQPRERQMLTQVTDLLAARLGTNADEWKEVSEARELLDRPVRERRDDGMPTSTDERYLRRLLAYCVAMPHTYYDDGEAQGQERGISIDFMRDPVADIDAKLRALNVARAACSKTPNVEVKPTATRRLE